MEFRDATAKSMNFRTGIGGMTPPGNADGEGRIANIQNMFDRIMENSMAMWMLVSALFPIFFFGTIIKAIIHFRRMKALREIKRRRDFVPGHRLRDNRVAADDWVPSR